MFVFGAVVVCWPPAPQEPEVAACRFARGALRLCKWLASPCLAPNMPCLTSWGARPVLACSRSGAAKRSSRLRKYMIDPIFALPRMLDQRKQRSHALMLATNNCLRHGLSRLKGFANGDRHNTTVANFPKNRESVQPCLHCTCNCISLELSCRSIQSKLMVNGVGLLLCRWKQR